MKPKPKPVGDELGRRYGSLDAGTEHWLLFVDWRRESEEPLKLMESIRLLRGLFVRKRMGLLPPLGTKRYMIPEALRDCVNSDHRASLKIRDPEDLRWASESECVAYSRATRICFVTGAREFDEWAFLNKSH